MGVAGVTVGPLVGLGAHWLRTRTDTRAALGVGGMAGILVGEGVYGLTVIAETTAPAYWWSSIALGVVRLVAAAALRLRGALPSVLALVTAALIAGAFVVAYVYGGVLIGFAPATASCAEALNIQVLSRRRTDRDVSPAQCCYKLSSRSRTAAG